jgi:hypothetical protein
MPLPLLVLAPTCHPAAMTRIVYLAESKQLFAQCASCGGEIRMQNGLRALIVALGVEWER